MGTILWKEKQQHRSDDRAQICILLAPEIVLDFLIVTDCLFYSLSGYPNIEELGDERQELLFDQDKDKIPQIRHHEIHVRMLDESARALKLPLDPQFPSRWLYDPLEYEICVSSRCRNCFLRIDG